MALEGTLADADEAELTEDSYELEIEALDAAGDHYGAGVTDITVSLDGQPVSLQSRTCADTAFCDLSRRWTWDTTGASNGPHNITVTARDAVDNVVTEEINVDLYRPTNNEPRQTAAPRASISGASSGDRAGWSVTEIGDFDADGKRDYAVGAPGVDGALRPDAGAVYLVSGSEAAQNLDLGSLPAARRITGPRARAHCGAAVANVGDVTGDGVGDLAVGCPAADPAVDVVAGPIQGEVFVVSGSRLGTGVALDALGDGGFAIEGPQQSVEDLTTNVALRPRLFGDRISGSPAGSTSYGHDVNRDGIGDLVLGASALSPGGRRNAGSAFIVFGKSTFARVLTQSLGTEGVRIDGANPGERLGNGAAIIGDVDNDGRAEAAIGAPATQNQGAVHVTELAGQTGTHTVTSVARKLQGPGQLRFGFDVVGLGDTDLDNWPDFAVASAEGAYVVRDKTAGVIASDAAVTVSGPVNGTPTSALTSTTLAAVGDVNRDGRADLAVGFPDAQSPTSSLILSPERSGRTLDVAALPGHHGVKLLAAQGGGRVGAAIAGHEELRDDAGAETLPPIVLVAAPNSDGAARLNNGRVDVLSARASGPGTAQQSATGEQTRRDPYYGGKTTPYAFRVNDTAFRFGFETPILSCASKADGTPRDPATDCDGEPGAGQADYTGKPEAVLPKSRATVKDKVDSVPQGLMKYGMGNSYRYERFVGGNSYELRDSFDTPYAIISQASKVVAGKSMRVLTVKVDGTTIIRASERSILSFRVQGYGCVNAEARAKARVFVALTTKNMQQPAPTPSDPNARETTKSVRGISGFIDRAALNDKVITDERLAKTIPNCSSTKGLKAFRSTYNSQQLAAATGFETTNSSGTVSDRGEPRYLGRTTARRLTPNPTNPSRADAAVGYTAPRSGVGYSQSYESALLRSRYSVLTASTTGTTGTGSNSGGGVAIAVVPNNSKTYDRFDFTGYPDPNVPCQHRPQIRWLYGDFNPGGRPIIAWAINRVEPGKARACPQQVP